MNSAKTVYLMMSGGVDSSVAAVDLVEAGYKVVGIYIKSWTSKQLKEWGLNTDQYGTCWEQESDDAMVVAKQLGIDFKIWDLQNQYKQKVADYMIEEYKKGRTPNPDVMCNMMIKFGSFYGKAMREGADYIATGHYARMNEDRNLILRGEDKKKDQTYFLWRIKKDRISKILFPIGKYKTKQELRKRAEELDLITAKKKDSQGICFIGKAPLREILLKTIGEKEGEIVSETGEFLGNHPGAYLYTIGQRGGLGLAGGPWFVTKIDIEKNLVVVSHQENQKSLYKKSLKADNLNWFVDLETVKDLKCQAQVRYRQTPEECTIQFVDEDFIEVEFKNAVRAIASGQSIVFYDGETMLGGGVIC